MTYYTKKLSSFVEDLISDNKKRDSFGEIYLKVDDLDELDQYRFAKNLIENDDRDMFSIYENDDYDNIISSLIKMLNAPTIDNKLDFAEVVRDKIVEYYKPKMQTIINEFIGVLEYEKRIDQGFSPRQHKDNGEQYWGRP
jgi:hypothetical protein